MIGQWLVFQTDDGALEEGEVINYVPYTGIVTVRNDNEDVRAGSDDHVLR